MDTLTGSTLVLSTWNCKRTKAGGISHAGMDLQRGQGWGLSCFAVRVPQNSHLPWGPAWWEPNLLVLSAQQSRDHLVLCSGGRCPNPIPSLFAALQPQQHPKTRVPQGHGAGSGDMGMAVGTRGWQWGHKLGSRDMGTLVLPRNLRNVGNTREKTQGFLSRGGILAAPPAAAGAMNVVWGHSSAGTEPPSTSWLGELTPSLCGLCKDKPGRGNAPPGVGNPRAVGLVARGGCSRWRGGQGTRVPVSQLCPNHQLPHSSCCSAQAPSPKLPWGLLSPVSSRCPSPPPGPARPQLPEGMALCPPAGPRSAGSHCPSRQRGAGRAGHGGERAGTGTGPWQGHG